MGIHVFETYLLDSERMLLQQLRMKVNSAESISEIKIYERQAHLVLEHVRLRVQQEEKDKKDNS